LIDDGGHTYEQQLITVLQAIQNMNGPGLIIVEDIHTSYMKSFGSLTNFTFIDFAKRAIDKINSRYSGINQIESIEKNKVKSIQFFESMVAFQIVANLPNSFRIQNKGLNISAIDVRAITLNKKNKCIKFLGRVTILSEIIKWFKICFHNLKVFVTMRRYRDYFDV
jgi:hypothetical protein